MKKALILLVFLSFSPFIYAQDEIGPDGDKLLGMIVVLVVLSVVFLILMKKGKKTSRSGKQPFLQFKRVRIDLEKDRMYYPDTIKLTVKNTGNSDIDLDRPLLVFDNFWLKRKFRLNGTDNRVFYPLYLEKGKTHTLEIDINRFYFHDKSLKKFPKSKITLYDMSGKRLGSKSVFFRKTLFKY
jgi:hypothetical protein